MTLAVLLAASAYFELAVRAQLSAAIISQLSAVAQTAMNSAVADFLAENPDAGKRLSALSYSESGAVTAVTTDPAYINFVKTEVSLGTQRNIDLALGGEGIEIPLGGFTGLVLISELGPRVRLDIDGRCDAVCSLDSRFVSAGINQTAHHITLTVKTSMAVYDPFRIKEPVITSADFEIAQTVIVGSVPSYGGVISLENQ